MVASSLLFALVLLPQESFDDLARKAESALESHPAEAASLYRQALSLHPNWVEGWFYLGASLYQIDRYTEAADAFRHAVLLAPGHGTARAFLGLAEAELDDPDQALADFRKGEELGLGANLGFEIAVRVKAARLLILTWTFDEALAQLQPLAKHKQEFPGVVETMGLCALSLPAKLSELTPERRAVVALAGKAAWSSVIERPEEAATAYQQLLERYPNEPGVHYAKGLYLMETDLNAALAEFKAEVQSNPKHWPAFIVLANLTLKQGEVETAMRYLNEAMKLVPLNFRWLCHAELGRANLTSDNLEAAIAELKVAARLKPTLAPVHFLLADAYRRTGKTEEAQKETAEFQRLKAIEDPLGVTSMRPFAGAGRN